MCVGQGVEDSSELERELRLAAVLISPFRAKCVSLGRGLSVLGRPTRNQVSPPISSPALYRLLPRSPTYSDTHPVIVCLFTRLSRTKAEGTWTFLSDSPAQR